MEKIIYLVVPFVTIITCQFIKFVIESIKYKKLQFARFFNGMGGMPSSHTAFTFSLTFTILLNEGYSSPLFAISLIFSMVVAYDAMGLRMESGKQAVAINQIIDEIFSKKLKEGLVKLQEQLGHKPLEVFCGIVLAFIISLIFKI